MTTGGSSQQAHDSQHRNGQVPLDPSAELAEGVFHLLIADEDLYLRAFRRCVTLCGAVVQPSRLPPSPFDHEIGDGSPRYCPECAREALRWSAGAGLAGATPTGAAAR